MNQYPHVQAAHINAIREEGTKTEACDYLQQQWNETHALRAEVIRLRAKVAAAEKLAEVVREVIDYPRNGAKRRTDDGYPSEMQYDEFAYRRMVDSYREAAAAGLAAWEAAQ